MRDALTKDSRIHRDLSVGNIILVKQPGRAVQRGFLIDWEASDQVDEGGEAKRPGRAVSADIAFLHAHSHVSRQETWGSMSMRMLDPREVHGKHTFKDDMESLLYVVRIHRR